MTVIQLIIVGMILIIIATLTLAVLSYGAFKVRERRSTGARPGVNASTEPLFFERVRFTPLQRGDT